MAPTYQEPTMDPEKVVNTTDDGERVVISGMSGLYPAANSVSEFSNILYNKINPVTTEKSRWTYNHPEVVHYTGKVSGLDRFDAQFFKVHYRLGNAMDTMGRKLLEQAFQAIYDAGVNPKHLSGKKVGVYIGSCFSESEKITFYNNKSANGLGIAGCSKTMFANRISYWLNAKGPSMAIDEACCSSVGALNQAYQAIKRGECEAAIVGGANLTLHPQSTIHYGRVIPLAPDGKTKCFDENADGCAKSEAINVLFLQKAKNALRIYADVIHVKSEFTSIITAETGAKYGFYRDPSQTAKFLKQFYDEARISPKAVEYVEAFGSAIPEADKAELEAINEVFCKERSEPLLVGSVMSNVGYGEAPSGITAITKVLLGYEKGTLAGNLHCSSPRQDVSALREGRLRVLTDHQTFSRTYAAINGISVTGVNTHVLLHGHYKPKDPSRYTSNMPYLVTVSGRQEDSVKSILDDLKSRPVDPEELALLHNIHKTSIPGHMGRGFLILDKKDANETVCLHEKLEYFDDAKRPLWFVYSGMGSQWVGMGAQLMRIPTFAAAIERCRRVLEPKGIDIVHIITASDKTIFDNILHSFVGIAAIQIGLTDVLREVGIVPDKIIGHSVGELGCAYADGCLTADEMILAACARGSVSIQTPLIRGSMAAVGMGYQEISKMCPSEIDVACHNSSESSTISGPADMMREFVAELTAKKVFAKEVPCSNIPYHSRYIAKAGPTLLKYLKEVIKTPRVRSERWVSTSVPQSKWNDPVAKYSSAEYHTNNLLSPVLFEETSALISSNAVIVEVAPHGLLQAILKRSLPASCHNIALTRRGHPDNAYLVLEAIGNLYMDGYTPDIQALYPKVEFPVSTGTPMLSHLVQWEHSEKWYVPLYVSAIVKTAPSCKFVISVYDEEHSYLQGHVMRQKTVYPFAAALVAVWDTLSMSIDAPKRAQSVIFQDLHLYVQPVLHERRQLKLSVALQRGNGRFEIMDNDSKVATGTIYLVSSTETEKYKMDSKVNNTMDLKANDIYRLLYLRDYSYSGVFRSIHSANASMTEAEVLWRDDWVTFIDGMLQLNVLKHVHDGISYPAQIRKITIDVNEHLKNQINVDGATVMKAHISDVLDNTRCGGVLMESIQFRDISPMLEELAISTLKVDPHSTLNVENFGEYVSYQESQELVHDVTLQSSKIGDLSSLHWAQATETNGLGVKVTVHYAAIHSGDILRATGARALNSEHKSVEGYGMDFSGVTESGVRVMGIVLNGSCSTKVVAKPEFLWPVPAHWTLEDAATVPLAYIHAFYCLRNTMMYVEMAESDHKSNILIHEGSEPLGQALISVALAMGFEVFTTVSDLHKKQFLQQLFPKLKGENIGNSRDSSFGDMVLSATNGEGCDIVISCLKGELKNESIKCCRHYGVTLDTAQLTTREEFSFGMSNLTKSRSYTPIDFSSIFKTNDTNEIKALQELVSEGIARGYVRPLSRVTYASHESARAFRLLAASRHRGRVLLKLSDSLAPAQPKIKCKPDCSYLILCDHDEFGLQLADRLVNRGAKKLYLHFNNPTSYLNYKIRLWKKLDVEVVVSSKDISQKTGVHSLLSDAMTLGHIEGVYTILTADSVTEQEYTLLLKNLDLASRDICSSLRYFAVVSTNVKVGWNTCLSRTNNGLPGTFLSLANLKLDNNNGRLEVSPACYRGALNALERALCSTHPLLIAERRGAQPIALFNELAKVADLCIPEKYADDTTLEDLGVLHEKLQHVSAFLRDNHNINLSDSQILALTVSRIMELEESMAGTQYDDTQGLESLISYVDPDELLATVEMIFLPTLANSSTMKDDEFDASQTYLCIVPGLEGHYERFREMCERLKLPALVLQPGVDMLNETIEEMAQRHAKTVLKKTSSKNNFYLLGYEFGVLVALEVAAILEEHGQSGTVFCLGGGPEDIKIAIEKQLSEFETEEKLQNAIALHLVGLMGGVISPRLKEDLQNASSWRLKVDACVQSLRECVIHSAQYARMLIESAFARITQVRHYSAPAVPLRSQIVLLRAAGPHSSQSAPPTLQAHSRRPVAVHDLTAPLPHATSDMRCAAIINSYLDDVILDEFKNKNLCDTYLANDDVFVDSSLDV